MNLLDLEVESLNNSVFDNLSSEIRDEELIFDINVILGSLYQLDVGVLDRVFELLGLHSDGPRTIRSENLGSHVEFGMLFEGSD